MGRKDFVRILPAFRMPFVIRSVTKKVELRREMRARLKTLGDSRAEKSRAIVAAILAHPALANANTLALFDPLPNEPDIAPVSASAILAEKSARRFCYPRVVGEELIFLEIRAPHDLLPS